MADQGLGNKGAHQLNGIPRHGALAVGRVLTGVEFALQAREEDARVAWPPLGNSREQACAHRPCSRAMARQPMSERQKPSGQSILAIAA